MVARSVEGSVPTLELEVNLRQKNLLTLPEEVVRRLGLAPGDRLVVTIDEAQPDRVELRPIRRSYAGVLTGLYGTDEEALEYVRGERESWDQ
jgi:bifunctional DNA-binding transcriptional regulator/antitoxin component of YhaV-PrlF toxin-antitoxin module